MWRTGLVFDLTGDGRTALKASYSRYALQVGIDRVTAVNPLTVDRGRARGAIPTATASSRRIEITMSQCGAFSGGLNTFYPPTASTGHTRTN